MLKDMAVIKATVNDAEALMKLRLQLVKENPKTYGVLYGTEKKKGIEHFVEQIEQNSSDDSGIFLLKKDGEIVGMGAIKSDNPDDGEVGYLGSLGILKEYQGKGLGEYLLKYRLNWIKKNTRFKKVKMITQKDNIKMLSLAKKYGFKIVSDGSYYNTPEYYLEKEIQ